VITLTPLYHEAAVERGVELLDAKLGRDTWLPRIDVNRLDVGSLHHCVACQATGHRWFGLAFQQLFPGAVSRDDVHEFEGSPSRSEHYGFGLRARVGVNSVDFANLTYTWIRKIEQLRGEVTTRC
jgi:hypothetical protein